MEGGEFIMIGQASGLTHKVATDDEGWAKAYAQQQGHDDEEWQSQTSIFEQIISILKNRYNTVQKKIDEDDLIDVLMIQDLNTAMNTYTLRHSVGGRNQKKSEDTMKLYF
jgi:hypothetical protein